MKHQRTEDNPLWRYSSRNVRSEEACNEVGSSRNVRSERDGNGQESSATSSSTQRAYPTSLDVLAQLTTADDDPLEVGEDPAEQHDSSASHTRTYEETTNLGPLKIRMYHDWRRRQLRRAGSQS